MSFACRARRFHILRSFYNTSQVIKPLLLQVDYKMVRQTLAFLVLFIVVTLQSAQIQGYSFWKLCVGVCVGPIPFWVPGCQRLCWALSYQGAHSMPALAETFFFPRKTLFAEHGIAKKTAEIHQTCHKKGSVHLVDFRRKSGVDAGAGAARRHTNSQFAQKN